MREGVSGASIDALNAVEEDIGVAEARRDQLYKELKAQRSEKRDVVTDILYELQDSLEPDERLELVRMREEYGRGGRWFYTETLTSDGMIATDITYQYGPGQDGKPAQVTELSHWSADEPFDIRTEYLIDERRRLRHIDAIADRLMGRDDDGFPTNEVRHYPAKVGDWPYNDGENR